MTRWRVALTRPEAGELGDRLLELGAELVHVPLIAIADPADGGIACRAALDRLDDVDWLVVTSANGARRVGAAAAGHPHVRLAAVGRATADVLAAESGRPVDVVPALERAEGLLAAFPPPPVGGRSRVLLAQADRARPALAEGLDAAGHDVESVVAYRTVERRPSPDEVAALATADAVVLASGSAASAYAAAVPAEARGAHGPVVVAIGPVTAAAAEHAGLTVSRVAGSPDVAGLVRLLQSVRPQPAP